MSKFIRYQTYAPAAAEPLLTLLRARDLPFETSTDAGQAVFDATFANNASFTQFVVKLHPGDLDWVRRLEADTNRDLLSKVDADHYSFKFSDEELLDLLVKQDEWNHFDVALAGQRGRDVSAGTIERLRRRRVWAQAQPEESHGAWLALGYVSALLGGLLGIFLSAHLHWHRKRLANGQRVPAFSATDRNHGLRIFVLGLLMFVFTIAVQVLQMPS